MGDIKKVIILGAGASKSDGAPLQRDLFKDFFDHVYKRSKNNILLEEQEEILLDFFKIFWNIDIQSHDDAEFPTFEDCLGILDIAYARGESFRGYKKEKINQTRDALIFLIGKVLNIKLNGKTNDYHLNLVNRLKDENKLLQTSFISLNYDLIIDNVLGDLYNNEEKLYLDYGINFANPEWKKPVPGRSISLLKIHGSLNWLQCPTCNQMEYTYNRKNMSYSSVHENTPCKGCQTPMEPVIIPPTFYKNLNNHYIQEIFLKSEKVLMDANEVFICGYSFPDADIFLKYILKRAELFNQKSPKLYIINRNPERNPENRENTYKNDKISRIFKNKANINFTDLSFQEFCEDGCEDSLN